MSSGMKSETVDEARERMRAMSEAEKEGADRISEGQVAPARDEVPLDEQPEAQSAHAIAEELRREPNRRQLGVESGRKAQAPRKSETKSDK